MFKNGVPLKQRRIELLPEDLEKIFSMVIEKMDMVAIIIIQGFGNLLSLHFSAILG
jgi:hypothetical protein